ncbi:MULTISPECIES: DUF1574 family protein [Cyanophyceae]|uniref:DUF1574 family protein n=1 Tax=Cyanophyceae TaxID=3028117 RepID=UPI00168496E7|nr:DUF1574 family protein [Trichocoleus sp. FACHB-40]MBD2006680.1 DUF1574 family protein [Trichocoleus sp. FACHB-40]
MLDTDQIAHTGSQSSLAQWVHRAIGLPEVRLRFRLRGNNLHILCEGSESPPSGTVVSRFVQALKVKDEASGFPAQADPIDQVIFYGRALGCHRPDWVKQIPLQELNPHQSTAASKVETSDEPQATTEDELTVSNRSLARSGQPEAIAQYLGETLTPLGVGVKVAIKNLSAREKGTEVDKVGSLSPIPNSQSPIPNPQSPIRRLWILCESDYSPDESLLAQPVAQQLRNLKLEGFLDAVICSQVRGEKTRDWLLRVDLTPPEEMLKDWAGWGDIQAIARLLNQALQSDGMQVSAVLKDVTLHLFCSKTGAGEETAPDKQTAMGAIAPVLEILAPQGIQAATVYGVETHGLSSVPEQETPIWIDWLNLPATVQPALTEPTLKLAQHGDLKAIQFLLERLLNPDLEERLETGGISLSLRRKQDLLHFMSEALICPQQSVVGPPIAKFVRQLAIPGIAGVRIYGRRAGKSSPLWQMGADFVARKRLVPEATPEFAASDAYLGELLSPTDEPVLRPDVTKEDVKAAASAASGNLIRLVQQMLSASQLFIPTLEIKDLAPAGASKTSTSIYNYYQGFKVALVWGVLGLLLTVQTDWLLTQMLKSKPQLAQSSAFSGRRIGQGQQTTDATLPKLSLQKSPGANARAFNSQGFTRDGDSRVTVSKLNRANASSVAILAAARSPNPSFNNRLLDEKLALYQQLLTQRRGVPPDVLIVGSSRAMRGIDPTALEDALAAQGYPGVKVFNFGINGATAQVVDFQLRQVLTSEQLPKLIIWADGARAFNSGRVDTTFSAIAASRGFKQLLAGTFPKQSSTAARPGQTAIAPATEEGASASLSQSYQSVNSWLNEKLGTVSQGYTQRDQMKAWLRDQYAAWVKPATPKTVEEDTETLQEAEAREAAIDFDGFLPLSVRFNPATYYQRYARVSGSYDSDYESFKMDGNQAEAMEKLLKFSQDKQIPIVFVNLPLTQDYLDPVRTEHEQAFQQYMRSLSLQKGLIFRDLSQLYPTKHDYFSDPSHLNRYGAYEVSNQLAQDPMIPWIKKD